MPRERSRSSTSARLASVRLGDERPRAGGVAVELLLRHAEVHRQRDEPRLRAVVEVALDPLQLGGLGVDGACARALESATRRRSLGASSPRARWASPSPAPRVSGAATATSSRPIGTHSSASSIVLTFAIP